MGSILLVIMLSGVRHVVAKLKRVQNAKLLKNEY